MRLFYLVFLINSCLNLTAQNGLLSLKKLIRKPVYIYYHDSLFTIDEVNCKKIAPKKLSEVYRLKVYPDGNFEYKYYRDSNSKFPYWDFSKLNQLLDSLPNLQYLDLWGMPMWAFPEEILKLKKLQIVYFGSMQSDVLMREFFSKPLPKEFWNMKSLKYFDIPYFLVKQKNNESWMRIYNVIGGEHYEVKIRHEWNDKLQIKKFYALQSKYDINYAWKTKYNLFNPQCNLDQEFYIYDVTFEWKYD